MKWIKVEIATEDIESVCTALTAMGVDCFEIVDEKEFREFLGGNKNKWDYIDEGLQERMKGTSLVTVYCGESDTETMLKIKGAVTCLKEKSDSGVGISVQYTLVDDEDWENNWKCYYKPFEVGEKLLICPSWESPPITERLICRLNPGLCFGAGTHATTQLCMMLLEKHVKQDVRCLDVGCGSGILSVASLILGASFTKSIDIDCHSPKIVSENMMLNHFDASRFSADEADFFEGVISDKYDIVVANIVADVIIKMISGTLVRSIMDSNSFFIVSGIITERMDDVADAIRASEFSVCEQLEKDGWHALVLGFQPSSIL